MLAVEVTDGLTDLAGQRYALIFRGDFLAIIRQIVHLEDLSEFDGSICRDVSFDWRLLGDACVDQSRSMTKIERSGSCAPFKGGCRDRKTLGY